jgi:outer membrane protein OmpA-like peptidoglycan-associated protein
MPILSAVLLTAATPAVAQVTVDLRALQTLPDRPASGRIARPAPSAPAPSAPAPSAPAASTAAPNPATVVTREPQTPREPQAAAPAVPPAPQPAMPETMPDTASIAPIAPPPPAAGAPPPPPPVSEKAATAATPTTTGLRLTFAPGEADLSPDSSTSIKQLAAAAPTGDATTFNVLAYAPGKPDDPSTARRVSLSRAMAVRSALVADGVPSARIFVRALGEQYGEGPPDRVDLSVTRAGAPADTATAR